MESGSRIDYDDSGKEIVEGRLKKGIGHNAFFLGVQKIYDTVWRDKNGTKRKEWRIMEVTRSVVFRGKKSVLFINC